VDFAEYKDCAKIEIGNYNCAENWFAKSPVNRGPCFYGISRERTGYILSGVRPVQGARAFHAVQLALKLP